MPLLANIINPYLWTGVIEDPNPENNIVYVNNLPYNKDTLEAISSPEKGLPGFYFQPGSEIIGVSDGPNWYDWPIILTTDKYGLSWSDSRQNWPSRIGSWDPWLLFLDYNQIKSRSFYNPITGNTSIYFPRDMTGVNMRQDVWNGKYLNWTTSYTTTTQNNYIIPAILRDDNQWLALDQNYYGTTIVWLTASNGEPIINQQITYNDRLQHFVLGNDDLGRSWFLEVHGNTHAYTVQVVGANNFVDNIQIPSTLARGITGGYTGVINQFPSNFIPNNSKRKVFYSSHYDTSASLAPRRFVWDQAKGTIEYSLCTLTYPNVGDTYGTYAQVCTNNNFNDYGTNSWYIKPHVFVQNSKYYITFCTVEKSQPYYRSERWVANDKQRAWVTYEISSTDDNILIFNSAITWPTVDDMPRMFLPMNPDGDRMLVFQTNRVSEIIFSPTLGWSIRKITSLDVRSYGIDSTGRIYLTTRSGAQPWTSGGTADSTVMDGYNSIYTYDTNLPNNINITFDSPSGYNYTGSSITTNCIVNTNDQLPMRVQGDTHISNWSPFANGYSVRTSFAAANAGRISAPNSQGFDFRTGDFCVEFWMFNNIAFSSQTNNCGIVGHKTGDAYFGWQIYRGGDSKLTLRLSSGIAGAATTTFDFKTTSDVPQDNLWHHWALVRQSGSLKWYLDGVLNSSVPSTHDIFDHHAQLWIGWSQTWGAYYSGWISNLRVTKGNCVYTTNFTVPTSPLTAIQSAGININAITAGQCTLLTCNSQDVKDNGNLTNSTVRLRINGTSATFSDGTTLKEVSTTNGTVSVPILITGNDYTSIDCLSIIPLSWITPQGSLTNAATGESYSYRISIDGGEGATYAIISGQLPPGLTLDTSTGWITGTPTNETPNIYNFTIRVNNSTDTIQRNFSIYASLNRPVINSIIYSQAASNIFVANVNGGETIAVLGSNFRTGAQVLINNQPQPTTYINSTRLEFTSPALAVGLYDLTVYNSDNVSSSITTIKYSSLPYFITNEYLPAVLESLPCEVSITASSDSALTWSVVSSNLPGTCSFNTATQKITGNPGPATGSTYNLTLRITDEENQSIDKTYIFAVYSAGTIGQVAYTTPGTYTWVCPVTVSSISVVAIGGGGSGTTSGGGGGGGLGWKNNISVTGGQSYTIVVGSGGNNGNNGNNTYFISLATVAGYGGMNGNVRTGGAYTGDGGGNGGNGGVGSAAGGAGAAGYTASGGYGGAGNFVQNTVTQSGGNGSGGGGGGGGGTYNTYGNGNGIGAGGGGGGTGIYGQGSNGVGAVMVYESPYGGVGHGGTGGSNGTNGSDGSGNFFWQSQDPGGSGGNYGGGGGGPVDGSTISQGGGGAVRIIWGQNRSWPSTNTADS
jgi:hypothetical protein